MIGKRIELDGNNVEKGGQQFVTGRALKSDGYTNIHRIEPHGFSSMPVKGAKALLVAPNGDADQAFVFGGEHPGLRPSDLPSGATAIYDSSGNIIKLIGSGIVIQSGGVKMVISPDGVAITGGTITHNGKNIGDTHIHGGVVPGGGTTDVPV
ncbi:MULTISPECIES: phage baseplate assembly protein [unclassified Rhizobium]|uniref:phage baseplate assembly protein domain-containing protein n=1 Tax=unclassified Rhizobium TaxID=2613769 RepID=UPI00146C0074|nr:MULTISPECIES: phage baseplate assembly protein [unclassified Rhizobium]MBD9445754.1 phage baseplate assembly protein [Rhizobium sp. RHZ01]NMN73854.1 Mu-like prophage protein gp45 [Rhizobium sp. 57MFTsu3.2]